jgi:transitional endoplasmic reticulum ATPase
VEIKKGDKVIYRPKPRKELTKTYDYEWEYALTPGKTYEVVALYDPDSIIVNNDYGWDWNVPKEVVELITNEKEKEVEKEKSGVKKVEVFEVVKSGDKIVVPESVSYEQAIKTLQDQMQYEESIVNHVEEIPGYFVLDAAHAFYQTLLNKFGLVQQEATRSFFGTNPPQLIQVQVSATETANIPWGRISIPTMEGGFADLQLGHNTKGAFLSIGVKVKRKFSKEVASIILATKEYLKKNSIYKGKAIEVKFWDKEEGERLQFPEVKFMDTHNITPSDIVLNDDVQESVDSNIFTPIRFTKECVKLGIPLKRGVLLTGPYGTGKSLVATLVAKEAIDNEFTFIYTKSADEFLDAYEISQFYTPAVVFCEDIDTILAGNRNDAMNEILNALDGLSSKSLHTIAVFTTNHKEKINEAFLRPGRLDSVIEVTLPTATSVQRLLRLYGRGLILDTEDLTTVSKELEGKQPAIIREVVEKAKLIEIKRRKGVGEKFYLTATSLQSAAEQMKPQMEMLNGGKKEEKAKVVHLATFEAPSGDGSKRLVAKFEG